MPAPLDEEPLIPRPGPPYPGFRNSASDLADWMTIAARPAIAFTAVMVRSCFAHCSTKDFPE